MKMLVVGGAGFIGSHLVEKLVAEEHAVHVIDDLSYGKLDNLRSVKDKIFFHKTDVTRRRTGREVGLFRGYDVIYYLACFPRSRSFEDPYRDLEVNYGGMVRILHDVKDETEKPLIIFASNSGIYDTTKGFPVDETYPDNPKSPYDLNKLTTENIVKMYHKYFKIPFTLFRFATVYGPRQKLSKEWHPVVMEFCDKLLNGTPPTIDGTGEQTRDFIYVGDIVSALETCIYSTRAEGETFLVSTNRETSINQLYETVEGLVGASFPPLRGPGRLGEIGRMKYDSSKIQDVLGWKPLTSFEDGVEAVIEWLRKEKGYEAVT